MVKFLELKLEPVQWHKLYHLVLLVICISSAIILALKTSSSRTIASLWRKMLGLISHAQSPRFDNSTCYCGKVFYAIGRRRSVVKKVISVVGCLKSINNSIWAICANPSKIFLGSKVPDMYFHMNLAEGVKKDIFLFKSIDIVRKANMTIDCTMTTLKYRVSSTSFHLGLFHGRLWSSLSIPIVWYRNFGLYNYSLELGQWCFFNVYVVFCLLQI